MLFRSTEGLSTEQRGPYQIQAQISAVHACAPSHDETDWYAIVGLYQSLQECNSSPVIRLNHAVALSFAAGPGPGLAALSTLADELSRYQPFHAARADLLRRDGQLVAAADAYRAAISLSDNEAQRRFLHKRLQAIVTVPRA